MIIVLNDRLCVIVILILSLELEKPLPMFKKEFQFGLDAAISKP